MTTVDSSIHELATNYSASVSLFYKKKKKQKTKKQNTNAE